jgi:hypothetical protein
MPSILPSTEVLSKHLDALKADLDSATPEAIANSLRPMEVAFRSLGFQFPQLDTPECLVMLAGAVAVQNNWSAIKASLAAPSDPFEAR